MSFAYRRASKTMLVTTATTFFSFLATAVSPLMPLAAFGFWSACVIAMNYVLVISLFPAAFSFWYQYIRKIERCPQFFKNGCKRLFMFIKYVCFGCIWKNRNEDNGKRNKKFRVLEKFLGVQWSNFVIRFRYYLITITVIFVAVSAWKASTIRSLTKQESWYIVFIFAHNLY